MHNSCYAVGFGVKKFEGTKFDLAPCGKSGGGQSVLRCALSVLPTAGAASGGPQDHPDGSTRCKLLQEAEVKKGYGDAPRTALRTLSRSRKGNSALVVVLLN